MKRSSHHGLAFGLKLTLLALATQSMAADTDQPGVRFSTITAHDRSALILLADDQPVCVFYAHGELDGQLSAGRSTESWEGHIEHTSKHSQPLRYNVRYHEQSPELVSINGRLFRIPPTPDAADEAAAGKRKVPWFVLTSYGRPIPTGRYFSAPVAADLNQRTQYSHAYYFDQDLYAAESQRNTLEMDDLDGWIIAWDEQHCVQHSDHARVAKLRIYGNGQVIVNRGRFSGLIQKQISAENVKQLRFDLMMMCQPIGTLKLEGTDGVVTLDTVTIDESAAELIVTSLFSSPLRNYGLWDQYQDFVTIRTGRDTRTLQITHPGPSDPDGNVPAGWEAMRDRLTAIMRTETSPTD